MRFRSKQTLMLAGSHQKVRVSGSLAVPMWVKLLISVAVAAAVAWVAFDAARAQAPTPGMPVPGLQGDVQAAALVKQGLWADAESKSSSASIAVDSQGGIHGAYIEYVPLAEHPQAVYIFCPGSADCADGANWSSVSFLDEVDQVQVAVTPAGLPRLMIRVNSQEQPGARDYHYAECNSRCTEAGSWSTAMIAREYSTLGDVFTQNSPRRSFALDPQGRPRFVYSDRNYVIEPDHYGAFYLWCDANCADHTAANPTWHEVNIARTSPYDAEIFDLPSLAFTPGGKPRIVTNIFPINEEQDGVFYVGCDSNCGQPASWERVWLHERGSETDPSWDIEVNSSGLPRVAIYEGSQLEGAGEELFYLWCDDNCFTAAGWRTLNLGLGKENGIGVDLELHNNKPRLFYVHDDGLAVGLAECNAGCDAASGWSSRVLETSADIEAEFPVARPVTCDAGFWDMRAPKLALTAAGSPVIAYNAAYEARCLYEDPNYPNDPPYYRFHEVRHNMRLAFWGEGTDGGNGGDGGTPPASVVYLPMVRR